MDKNKLKVLQDIDYRIPANCGMCEHGDFVEGADFGVCKIHTYEHQKHTAALRQLSIHKNGTCSSVEVKQEELAKLGTWEEFVEGGIR